MSSNVRINTTATFVGGLVLQNSTEGFPLDPRIGQFFVKDFQLYAYLRIGELETWYPLAARTRSYVHSQAQASTVWRVDHNLGTTDVWYTVTTAQGVELVNKQTIDSNSFLLNFDEPLSGTVVVVAPDSLSVPTVTAGQINVGEVQIGSDGVRIGGQYVLTDTSMAAQINAAVANLVDLQTFNAEVAARQAAIAANAALISAETARAQATETIISNMVAMKANASLSNVSPTAIASVLGYSPASASDVSDAVASQDAIRAAADLANAQAIAAEISRAQTRENAIEDEVLRLRENLVTPELDSIVEAATAVDGILVRFNQVDSAIASVEAMAQMMDAGHF